MKKHACSYRESSHVMDFFWCMDVWKPAVKPAAARGGKRRSAASREKKRRSCKEGDCFLGISGGLQPKSKSSTKTLPRKFYAVSLAYGNLQVSEEVLARTTDAEVQASLLSAGWGVLSEGPAAGHCSCHFRGSKVGSLDGSFNADFSCTT